MLMGTIKARYRNGVIEPLEDINMPEDSVLEVSFKSVVRCARPGSAADESEGSADEKRKIQQEFIEQTSGLFKGIWGRTAHEIDDYLRMERESWDREF